MNLPSFLGGRNAYHETLRHGLTEIAALASMQEQNLKTHRFYSKVLDNLPVMAWSKDLEGNFTMTNRVLRHGLLLVDNPDDALGNDGAYFANRARRLRPDVPDWYTFGEICDDSDRAVLQRYYEGDMNYPFVFLEYGNVAGEFLALEVYKSPYFNQDGELSGTVGAAIDVTEKVEFYNTIIEQMSASPCGGSDRHCNVVLQKAQEYFERYHFVGSSSVGIS